jgi:hypothetical protein
MSIFRLLGKVIRGIILLTITNAAYISSSEDMAPVGLLGEHVIHYVPY